jgi:hypothetical protein
MPVYCQAAAAAAAAVVLYTLNPALQNSNSSSTGGADSTSVDADIIAGRMPEPSPGLVGTAATCSQAFLCDVHK